VHLARVWAKKSPITGELVSADIVPAAPDQDAAQLRASIQQHCAARLERWKVPAIFRVVSELETNASGKIRRSAP